MTTLPDTPFVFESGVLRFDDDGTLHVHLTHSPAAPHPLVIQPGGEDDLTVAPGVTAARMVGGGEGHFRSRASLPETEALPEGLVLTFQGYAFVQIEMSGDVSVLMQAPESLPGWCVPGRVHRFDGPDDGVCIWTGSSPPPAPPPLRAPDPPPQPSGAEPSGAAPSSASSSASSSAGARKGGCGVLLVLLSATLLLPAALLL